MVSCCFKVLRAAKVPLEDIQYLMGHGDNHIALRYAEPDMDSLRQAVAKLDQPKTETDTASILHFKSP